MKKHYNMPKNIDIILGEGCLTLRYKGSNYPRVTLSGNISQKEVNNSLNELERRLCSYDRRKASREKERRINYRENSWGD